MQMLETKHELSLRKQAMLLNIARSGFYYAPLISDDSEVVNLIREIYLSSDCRYGYRKVTAALRLENNKAVSGKKVLKVMQEIGIQGIFPRKFVVTTGANINHKIHPYLLSDLKIDHANHVWATDITYIRIRERFMYFVAIIDIYSRYIVAYELSYSLEAEFCMSTLRESLTKAKPEIFNSDQGSQFTSTDFTEELIKHNIKISMDHKGRCFDNIYVERLWRTLKQESIYYYRPETIKELEKCLSDFVLWYNNHRLHQSLSYHTPASVYLK